MRVKTSGNIAAQLLRIVKEGDIGFHVFAKVPINNCAMVLPPISTTRLQPHCAAPRRGE
jgi:hypothetical protein